MRRANRGRPRAVGNLCQRLSLACDLRGAARHPTPLALAFGASATVGGWQ